MRIIEPKLSSHARQIVEKRYLWTDLKGKPCETPGEMFWRVACAIAKADAAYDNLNLEKTARQFFEVMVNLLFLPAGRALFEAGSDGLGQLSSCFVLPIEDSISSIFGTLGEAAVIQKNNGGTGFNFSKIRPHGDKVKNVPQAASGPVDFLRAYDGALGAILQGSKRHGGNMAILNCDHPDILDFIEMKEEDGVLKNFNISVGVSDSFMEAVEKDKAWKLINPRSGEAVRKMAAGKIFDLIAQKAWETADPGLVFLDRLEKDNPTPTLGRLDATNPCVVGETLVATGRGLERMDKLYKGYVIGGLPTKILTDNKVIGEGTMKLRIATRFYDNGLKDVFNLKTSCGYELTATGDHKVFTPQGWAATKDLKKNDVVFLQSGKGDFNGVKNLPFDSMDINNLTSRKTLNLPRVWSKELGEASGWLIGDGWICDHKKNARVGFVFGKEDLPILVYLRKILNNWYGREIEEIERDNGVYHLSYHAKGFIEFFKKLGVCACQAEEKIVPESIFTATEEAVKGFLRGLFTADGTVNYQKGHSSYVRLTSASQNLVKGVQILLLNLGIKSRIYERKYSYSKGFEYVTRKGLRRKYSSRRRYYFELEISREDVLVFLSEIGFLQDRHEEKLRPFYEKDFYSSSFEDKVMKIEYIGKRLVYDLTEPQTFSFITNGFISLDCGEQPLLPYESCNLGSIVLSNHYDGEAIDWKQLRKTIRTAVHFLDNMIDVNHYPLEKIEKIVKFGNRKIGLGVMGFAHLLYKMRIPYDSEEAVSLLEKIMDFIRKEARQTSEGLAKTRGVFPNFDVSIYKEKGPRMRNATMLTIAPTGTISMVASTSSGIEPVFSLVTRRQVLFEETRNRKGGKTLTMVDPIFEIELDKLGFKPNEKEKILEQTGREGTVKNIKIISNQLRRVFVTAHEISWKYHVKMQAVAQKYCDNSVSKTINFPEKATAEEIKQAFLSAWKLGCKGITVYRDQSKKGQVLSTGPGEKIGQPEVLVTARQIVEEERGLCPECGAEMEEKEGCYTCPSCGYSYCKS